ncbi:MAG: hypothetical protein ACYDH5_12915 [Acidimicrobiales bacterium]
MSGPEPACPAGEVDHHAPREGGDPADDGHCDCVCRRAEHPADAVVAVRARVRYLSAEAARAVSAAQGRAILGVLGALDCIGGVEVDQDCTGPSEEEAP